MLKRLLIIWLALFAVPSSVAQVPSAEFRVRADMLVELLKGEGAATEFFAPSFLQQIPAAQVRALTQQLTNLHGPVEGLTSVSAASAHTGVVLIAYQRSTLRFNMTIEDAPPHRAIGLLVASVEARNDSAAKLVADFKALAGTSGFVILPLSPGAAPLLAHNADRRFAIGSGFKLWVLGEVARQVERGDRKWSDVVPLGPPSLPSGITQDWPSRTPMTLHSLATLMTSISDNTATDTLLLTLGRDRVGALAGLGKAPVLSTIEAFALKMSANTDLRARWAASDARGREALLRSAQTRLTLANIDRAQLGGAPKFIESIEWFATPQEMAETLRFLRDRKDPTARTILAVNKGIPPGDADRFDYMGFKGGSETGVIALNFLMRNKAGEWFAICGSWNNPRAAVDNEKFTALMMRAIALVR